MTHDFKATLMVMDDQVQEGIFATENYDAIQYALRLADRLQNGEISDAAVWEGMILQKHKSACPSPRDVFKALTAQMMKEVEDE